MTFSGRSHFCFEWIAVEVSMRDCPKA